MSKLTLIAECCQNHNGNMDVLRQMVDAAAEGGATHAKIQTIFANDVSFRQEFEEGKTENGVTQVIKRPYQPEYDRLKGLELTYEQHRQFIELCRAAGMEPLTTAFNLICIPHIAELGWKSVKVASYDCGSQPLLEALVERFDEFFVSTGASYDEEVQAASKILKDSGKKYAMLHCVTLYPTPLDQMHLARMEWLKQYAPQVGLSDHSLVARDGIKAALAAIYLGAEVIERHFTVLPEDQSRDGKVSIRKEHLKAMREFAALSKSDQKTYLDEKLPEFASMIGQANRPLSQDELLNRAYYRGRFSNKIDGKQIYNWENEARHILQPARKEQKHA